MEEATNYVLLETKQYTNCFILNHTSTPALVSFWEDFFDVVLISIFNFTVHSACKGFFNLFPSTKENMALMPTAEWSG